MLLITFNQENTILEALEGAVNQDYPNTEIIVCDDASQDSTCKRLLNYQKLSRTTQNNLSQKPQKYRNWRKHKSNHQIIEREFFFMTAGDDISLSHRVSTVMNFWKEKNHSVDLIACYLKDLDSESKTHE